MSALQRIAQLDAKRDHIEITQLSVEDGFIWDYTRALELALFRTFAAPRIGGLLDRTGEFEDHGQKRYDDTALLLLGMLRDGYEAGQGKASLERMNRIHAHFKIKNEDYLFVLSTFVVDPILWTNQFGWRKLTVKEQEALFWVWINIGERMGLTDLPESLQEMTEKSWAYVDKTFAHSNANQRVAEATVRIVEDWLPGLLRPFVKPVAECLLDESTRKGVGFKAANPLLKLLVIGGIKSRALMLRLIPALRKGQWPDGRRSYPDGYRVEDLVPAGIKKTESRAKQ